jgi:hypothetical protein
LGNFALSSNDHIRFGEVSTLYVIFSAPNVNPLVATKPQSVNFVKPQSVNFVKPMVKPQSVNFVKPQSVNFAGVKYQGVKFLIIATTLESL